jgi:hypothetical protein
MSRNYMNKYERDNYVTKSVIVRKSTAEKIDLIARQDHRKFSPWVALVLDKIAEEYANNPDANVLG